LSELDVIRTCALLHDIGKLECWANRKPWSEHTFYTYKFVRNCLGEEIAVHAMRHHVGTSYSDEYRPRTEVEKIVCLADNLHCTGKHTHTNNKTGIEDFSANLIFRTDYSKLRRNDENCRGELFLE